MIGKTVMMLALSAVATDGFRIQTHVNGFVVNYPKLSRGLQS